MMAAIEVQQEGEFPDFMAMLRQFPQLSARILAYVGKEAALKLASMMEAGEKGITFRSMRGNRKSTGGRRMITYSVGKGAKWVRISSFPLNLFEGGRMLRSGKRESARKILKGSLKNAMNSNMNDILTGAEKLIIDDWFNNRHKGGMTRI